MTEMSASLDATYDILEAGEAGKRGRMKRNGPVGNRIPATKVKSRYMPKNPANVSRPRGT
jgi:hypothetical protein